MKCAVCERACITCNSVWIGFNVTVDSICAPTVRIILVEEPERENKESIFFTVWHIKQPLAFCSRLGTQLKSVQFLVALLLSKKNIFFLRRQYKETNSQLK